MNEILNIDRELLIYLNSLHTYFFDNFMWLFTKTNIWIVFYISILYTLFRIFPTRESIYLTLAIILTIAVSDQLCGSFIRGFLVERLRPSREESLIGVLHIVNDYRGGLYGFPSCHATNSFALAIMVSLIFRYRYLSIFIFSWALLNSYTRIYLGVHYPGDIIVGAIVGMVIGYLIYQVLNRFVVIKRDITVGWERWLPLFVGSLTIFIIIVCSLIGFIW